MNRNRAGDTESMILTVFSGDPHLFYTPEYLLYDVSVPHNTQTQTWWELTSVCICKLIYLQPAGLLNL